MAKRKYDSRRRAESARRTREAIIEAAVKLHGEGITTLSSVAEEAGVSLPTVNKHFPNREELFKACTAHFMQTLEYPSPEKIAEISDPGKRLYRIVRQMYNIHEASFTRMWLSYKLEDESPTMAKAIEDTDALIHELVDLMLSDWNGAEEQKKKIGGFMRGLLGPLTYRSLRLVGKLGFEDAVNKSAAAMAKMLDIDLKKSE